MKIKKNFFIFASVSVALGAFTGMAFAQGEILNFDDLPFPPVTPGSPVPNGYGNLLWQNFSYLNVDYPSVHGGYKNGDVSPSFVVLNSAGDPAMIYGGSFNLDSAYLTAAWNDGLQVEVQGFVGATLTYDNIYTVNATGPTLINPNYLGVNEVNFISSGGTPHPGYSGEGEEFAMNNLSITFVPEPSTFALGAMSLILCCLSSRRMSLIYFESGRR